jgi:hypothetical protein
MYLSLSKKKQTINITVKLVEWIVKNINIYFALTILKRNVFTSIYNYMSPTPYPQRGNRGVLEIFPK